MCVPIVRSICTPLTIDIVIGNILQSTRSLYAFRFKSYDPKCVFSSAVPSGSTALQMVTRPSSAASTFRRGRANLRNASVFFSLFGMKLLWDDINNMS